MFISKNTLYLIVALMVTAIGVLGYQYYQSQQNSTDIQIKIGKDGLSIKEN
jgi:predicted negative regulator of RcsB-dependent stress response